VKTPNNGPSITIQFVQTIGWRTEDYVVIGQIVNTVTFAGDGPDSTQINGFETAIAQDLLAGISINQSLANTGFTAVLGSNFQSSVLGLLDYVVWGLANPYSTPQGPLGQQAGIITEGERYWMLENALNGSVDDPSGAPAIIQISQLPSLISQKQFRILHHYQVKFVLTKSGTIDTNPATLVRLFPIAAIGPTKANVLDFAAGLFLPNGWDNPGFSILSPPQVSIYNGYESTSKDLLSHSGYASGRIGSDGQNVNWHFFGQDAPWIFSEVICHVAADHTVSSSINMSVNSIWSESGGVVPGGVNFNNLTIYESSISTDQNGTITESYTPVAQLSMEGQLKPFITSVPFGTRTTPYTKPSVQ
jgi:hypothetical protein